MSWFQSILDGIAAIHRFGEWLRAWFQRHAKVVALLATPFLPLIALPLLIYWMVKHSVEYVVAVLAALAEWWSPENKALVADVLEQLSTGIACLNRFLPLGDILSIISLLMTIRGVMTLYGFVKSWIPGVGR